MIGAFHMPKLVYINLGTLRTLDKRQFWSGMGEVVKSALIKDEKLYYYLKDNIDEITSLENTNKNTDVLREIVYRCNIIKKNVVEEDPFETKGERVLLNFGHTLGHAIEKYMNFEYLHGECVSIGCILAAYISRDKGLLNYKDVEDIDTFIRTYFNIPDLKLSEEDIDKIVEITHSDKKSYGDVIKFILLNSIGNAVINTEVTDHDMKNALMEFCNGRVEDSDGKEE
jgi:3-dehydroquinate synthase